MKINNKKRKMTLPLFFLYLSNAFIFHIMKKFFITTYILFFIVNVSISGQELDSLIMQLENTMAERNIYDKKKESKLENLKSLLLAENLSSNEKYLINNQLIKEYEVYILDSALHYATKNLDLSEELEEKDVKNQAKLIAAKLLTSTGRYFEAADIQNEINPKELSIELLKDYYDIYRKIYSELSFSALIESKRNKFWWLHKAYKDSLLAILEPETEQHLMILEKDFRDERKLEKGKEINTKRLEMATLGSRTYSLVTFERSILYELSKELPQEKKFLILSAISDIKASVKDNASLTRLALLLYKEGEISRAHDYINFSFEDAKFYNSRLRFVAISSIFPLITEAYEKESEEQKNKLQTYGIITSILATVLLVSLIFIYKQLKKLARTRNELQKSNKQQKKLNKSLQKANNKLNDLIVELSETNHVKEQYIGNFLKICSNYIDKLDAYRKMVNKHIANRKVAELYDRTKSRQLIEMELNEFYENFDVTFLKIYPDFVDDFNKMLVEDDRIVLKKGERLNTELRIFALIRLGIKDSSKIAKLLRYSVNTIYNYRAKVKNSALGDRDQFEENIMKIGAYTK